MQDENSRIENIILERLDKFEVKIDDGFEKLWGAWHEQNTRMAALTEAMPATCALKHNAIKEEIIKKFASNEEKKNKAFRSWVRVILGSGGLL